MRVHVLSTGGTIAATGDGIEPGAALVARYPALAELATITVEDFARIPSSRITPAEQVRLARRVDEILAGEDPPDGVVVTHGTDSLEETALVVDLLYAGDAPVVFTGAMRPPSRPGSDAGRNLIDAVRAASAAELRGLGVLVVFAGEAHAARHVRKVHATKRASFASPGWGPLGRIDDGLVPCFRPRRVTLPSVDPELTVAVVPLLAGSDGRDLRALVAAGFRGLVVEAFGHGNVPEAVMAAVAEAREAGVVVAMTTRTGEGGLELSAGALELGVVCGEDLGAVAMRTLVLFALAAGESGEAIQRWVGELGEVHPGASLEDLRGAAAAEQFALARAMVRAEPRLVGMTGADARTALHEAAEGDQVELAELLIAAGGDLEALTDSGQTPLERALDRGSVAVAALLSAAARGLE